MSISDIIGICDILVTIFICFFLAHRFSVKDTRNRSAKDYYISELTAIRKNIENVFQNLLNGEISAKELVKRIEDIENSLKEFDQGVRVVLPIRIVLLQYLVGNCLDKLTDIDDINDQYESDKIVFCTDSRIKVRQISQDIHRHFANYLYRVNTAAQYGILHEIKSNYVNYFEYYKSKNERVPRLRSILYMFFKWVCQWEVLITLFIFISVLVTGRHLKETSLQHQERLNTIGEKLSDNNETNQTYIKHINYVDSLVRSSKRSVIIKPLDKQ